MKWVQVPSAVASGLLSRLHDRSGLDCGGKFGLVHEAVIEVRKYMGIASQNGTDHVFLVNDGTCERFDARDAGTPYFGRLRDDLDA